MFVICLHLSCNLGSTGFCQKCCYCTLYWHVQTVQHRSVGICESKLGCIMQMAMRPIISALLMWTRRAPHTARSFTGCPCPTRGMSCITAAGMHAHPAMMMVAKHAASSCCLHLALAGSMVPPSDLPLPCILLVPACEMLQGPSRGKQQEASGVQADSQSRNQCLAEH